MKYTISEMPAEERPYEKCIREGESALSDSELLAVILRCGTQGISSLKLANDILNQMKDSSYPGLAGLLHSSQEELRKIRGVGKVKAVQLKCIGELSRRIARASAKPALSFHQPESTLQHPQQLLCLGIHRNTGAGIQDIIQFRDFLLGIVNRTQPPDHALNGLGDGSSRRTLQPQQA